MKRIVLIPILLAFLVNESFGQGKAEINRMRKDAAKTLEYREYFTAIELYKQLLATDPNSAEYNYQLGVAYLNITSGTESIKHLLKAYDADPNYANDMEYRIGQAYQLLGDFEQAKAYYQDAKAEFGTSRSTIQNNVDLKNKERTEQLTSNQKDLDKVNRRLEECENGIQFTNQPVNATVLNIGSKINSEYPDYAPIIPQDSSFMVFTSRREGTTGGRRDYKDDLFYEDIYLSFYQEGEWSSPQNLGINKKYHDAGAAVSADGQELYLYRDNPKTKGDLYVAMFNAEQMTFEEPKKLNKNINTKHQETSLCLSADGNTMYFASDRPGGLGGLDIYVSRRGADGDWGEAELLQGPINTAYDDDAPFLAYDGKTLYFSSKGHNTMGGYDIFKSTISESGELQEPVNLGYPINGPDDDAHLVLTYDNRKGYFVSSDPSGYGYEDIYSLSAPTVMLYKLDKTGLSLSTPTYASNTLNPDSMSTTNSTSGVPEPAFSFKVLFGFDRAGIPSQAKASISSLLEYMKNYEKVRIEIGGHTDNIGPYQYNLALSVRRAQTIANFLISQGVDPKRIEVKGYSYAKPIAPNTTPANRALNRRAEYKILDNE